MWVRSSDLWIASGQKQMGKCNQAFAAYFEMLALNSLHQSADSHLNASGWDSENLDLIDH